MTRRQAFTLIETLVAVMVGTLLFLATMRLLSSGLSSSQRGAGHLTNMGAAAVLLAQIESDLLRAKVIHGPTKGETSDSASIELVTEGTTGPSTANYHPSPGANGGFDRSSPGGESHTFCRGLGVECRFTHIELPASKGHEGVYCALRVWTLPGHTEETRLQRFFACPNLEEPNRKLNMVGGQW